MDCDTVISISEEEDEDDERSDSDSVDDDEWNDEEVLKRVIQLSKLESAEAGSENSKDHSENQDLKKALELSLQNEPLIESSERPSSPEIPTVDIDDEESNDTQRRAPLDSNESNKELHEKIGGVFTDLASFESADSDDGGTSEKDKDRIIKLSSESDNDVIQDSIAETQSVIIEEITAPDQTSSSLKPLEEQSVILEETLSRTFPTTCTPNVFSSPDFDFSSDQLTSEEVSVRMRNIFESNLRTDPGEEMEACSAVRTKLFPHQRQALSWMMMRETSDQEPGVRGGILADDMGLGKTLTIIALILTNHWDKRPLAAPGGDEIRKGSGPEQRCQENQRKRKKTRRQSTKRQKIEDISTSSEDEFDQMAENRALHDRLRLPNSDFEKTKNPLNEIVVDISDNDSDNDCFTVVDFDSEPEVSKTSNLHRGLNLDGATEYSSEDDEPEIVLVPSSPQHDCDNLDRTDNSRHKNPGSVIFYSDSDLSDSPDVPNKRRVTVPPRQVAVRRGRRRPTLIVCPTSLISHWVEQLQTHVDPGVSLQVRVHHGQTKAVTSAELETQDIVITTYGTLTSEADTADTSPLVRAAWLRVVLDEGHNIKNHNTKGARAAGRLDTLRRWVVTGTPIQNSLMDLWSLINWLGFGVYAGRQQMQLFREQIEMPCKRGNKRGFERLQVLLDSICLRRNKNERNSNGEALVNLPEKHMITREVELDEEERNCYNIYRAKAREIISRFKRRGELMKNYAHVFALMTRLRQICCHRELITGINWKEALHENKELINQISQAQTHQQFIEEIKALIRSGVSPDCSSCLSEPQLPVITPCAHIFCRACLDQVLQMSRPGGKCPVCQSVFNKRQVIEVSLTEDRKNASMFLENMKDIVVECSSSKVNSTLKEVLRVARDFPGDKIVIVSQFTSFLSMLQPLLRKRKISFVRLDGSMNHMKRTESIKSFQSRNNNSPNVLLLSLKAGGVGLNLTAANHLMLLDPAWNPAAEWQCFDRIHRLGQQKTVYIYRFLVTNSVEEKMLEIQMRKQNLISGAFQSNQGPDQRRRRVEEVMDIFGF